MYGLLIKFTSRTFLKIHIELYGTSRIFCYVLEKPLVNYCLLKFNNETRNFKSLKLSVIMIP